MVCRYGVKFHVLSKKGEIKVEGRFGWEYLICVNESKVTLIDQFKSLIVKRTFMFFLFWLLILDIQILLDTIPNKHWIKVKDIVTVLSVLSSQSLPLLVF